MAEEKKEGKTLQISKEELEAYVEKSVSAMQTELNKHRNKPNYLRSNPYENLIDHFGLEPQKLIAEFELIQQKRSNQPSGIRAAIKEIVSKAVNSAIRDKINPPKPVALPQGVKVVSPENVGNLPEGSHLHVKMPELPSVPVMLPNPSAKKGRRAKK